MAFSYTLFLALLLLAPGFAFWAGMRIGERGALLSPAPDKPGSTTTLLAVIVGALIGHIGLAVFFALQASWCSCTGLCLRTSFDPNVYRELLTAGKETTPPSDWAIAAWFFALIFPALLVGLLGKSMAGSRRFRALFDPTTFGWLYPLVNEALPSNAFIVAYVVTTIEHEGSIVAYEGIVNQLSLDDDKAISMLVLSSCDRFLVRIGENDVARVDTDHVPIHLLHIRADKIANVALEVFVDADAETEAEDVATS